MILNGKYKIKGTNEVLKDGDVIGILNLYWTLSSLGNLKRSQNSRRFKK